MIGLANQNHRLNLAIVYADTTVECESCGYEIPVLKDEVDDLPEFVECSTCAADRRLEYRLKKMRENHTPKILDEMGLPIQIPPMIQIDTRDLPGFIRDDTAKRIGETLSLFKEKL
jgi:hypothetical protein